MPTISSGNVAVNDLGDAIGRSYFTTLDLNPAEVVRRLEGYISRIDEEEPGTWV